MPSAASDTSSAAFNCSFVCTDTWKWEVIRPGAVRSVWALLFARSGMPGSGGRAYLSPCSRPLRRTSSFSMAAPAFLRSSFSALTGIKTGPSISTFTCTVSKRLFPLLLICSLTFSSVRGCFKAFCTSSPVSVTETGPHSKVSLAASPALSCTHALTLWRILGMIYFCSMELRR